LGYGDPNEKLFAHKGNQLARRRLFLRRFPHCRRIDPVMCP